MQWGAAALTDNVSHLVLYEPSLGLPSEARAEQEWTYAGSLMDRITASTLSLSGSDSTSDVRQATAAARTAIPGARVRVLAGHAHIAHRTDPEMVAGIVQQFVTG